MKLPASVALCINKQKIFNLPVWLIVVMVVLLLVGGGYFYFRQFFEQSPIKTLDQFPVMIINNGQTAVYQEVRVSSDKIEKEIVVSSIGGDSKDTKIYEVIPKEVAEKVSDLEFSVKPTIIEDDPIILWDLPSMHEQTPPKFTYKAPVTLGISKSSRSKVKPFCTQKPEIVQSMKRLKYDPEDWDDCDFYVTALYKAAVDKNKQIREEKEKDQVELIQPGEAKYAAIQQKAKEVISPPKPTSASVLPGKLNAKISNDEAVAKARAGYDETANMECSASWNSQGQYYQVVCNRQHYSPYAGKTVEFNYTFYTVSKDGKANKIGNYYKESDKDALGKPMWGVK